MVKRWQCRTIDEDGAMVDVSEGNVFEEDAQYVLASDYDELIAAIKWVTNDARYKAPEQIDADMVARWLDRLNASLAPSTQGAENE